MEITGDRHSIKKSGRNICLKIFRRRRKRRERGPSDFFSSFSSLGFQQQRKAQQQQQQQQQPHIDHDCFPYWLSDIHISGNAGQKSGVGEERLLPAPPQPPEEYRDKTDVRTKDLNPFGIDKIFSKKFASNHSDGK